MEAIDRGIFKNIYVDYRKVEKPLPFENVTVEIGFGSGDYLLSLAKVSEREIFFGIEKSWIPVNKLIKKASRAKLNNLFCTKLDAFWAMQILFRDGIVNRIIMNYPDPWHKKSHSERRLTRKESLYVFGKKLKIGGHIKVRTDEHSYTQFTAVEAQSLNCFKIHTSKVKINDPLTKYEKRWLSLGKDIWDILLIKEKEPETFDIPKIKEVKELFPVKVYAQSLDLSPLEKREFKIDEGLYLRIHNIWFREKDYAVEILLSEQNFVQSFFVTVKKRDQYFIIDVSKFSEILKTEGVQKALFFLKKLLEA